MVENNLKISKLDKSSSFVLGDLILWGKGIHSWNLLNKGDIIKLFKSITRKIKRLFKSYYCIKQYDITDCGAACLATIAKHYDLEMPITQIREIAGTDKRDTNALGVIKTTKDLGF